LLVNTIIRINLTQMDRSQKARMSALSVALLVGDDPRQGKRQRITPGHRLVL
jgi:hypothetical protein